MKAIKKNTNNRQKFTFPPQEELERVIKKFSDPNCKEINIGLMPDASELDKTKYDICQSIAQPKRANCWLCNFYCILSVGLFCFY